ncbi:MAG: hypothetical protein KDK71_06610 [Chlamydiia bacterium]|nr:hypothetical protein [Chlamydiia bacterium]
MTTLTLAPYPGEKKTPTPDELAEYRQKKIPIGIFSGGLWIGGALLTVVPFCFDNTNAINALITTAAGAVIGGAIFATPARQRLNAEDGTVEELTFYGKVVEIVKDKIVNYSATFFIVLTQVYLNVPHPRWAERLVFGLLNATLGLQFAAVCDNIRHFQIKEDETEDLSSTRTIHMLTGNRTSSRIGWEVVKGVAGVGGILLGHFVPTATVAPKVGMLVLGDAAGSLFHEGIYAIKKRLDKAEASPEESESFLQAGSNYSSAHTFLIYLEKIEQVLSLFLPGFIVAFDTRPTDFFAGAFYGLYRQIDWIRTTQTPTAKIDELQERKIDGDQTCTKVMDVAKWAFAIFAVGGYLGYLLYQGIASAPHATAYAISTFAVVLYGSYLLSRAVDQQTLPSNRFFNNLFFFTCYSLVAPLLYIAIKQVLEIGDIALENYGPYETLLSCIAYGSLAFSFGTEAGRRVTRRNIPAAISPLIMLFTNFLAEQLRGK